MNLAAILKQLENLNTELGKAEKRHAKINDASDRLAKKFKEAAASTGILKNKLESVLPPKVLKYFDMMGAKIVDTVKASSALKYKYEAYRVSLGKSIQEWSKLKEVSLQYLSIQNSLLLRQGEQDRFDSLRELHAEYHNALSRKDYDTAAQSLEIIQSRLKAEKGLGVDAYKTWQAYRHQLEVAQETELLEERTLNEYKSQRMAFRNLSAETRAWTEVVKHGADLMEKLKGTWKILLTLTGIRQVMSAWHYINSELIEANSNLKHRLNLAKANFHVDLQIGAGYKKIAAAQAALLASGQKSLALDVRRVKTVTMMNVGLGMSVEDAAQLSLYAGLTGNDFERTANALAVVVNQTNLTAKEALNLSNTIVHVQRNLGLTTKSLPEISTAMGVIESAVKAAGGQEGAVGRLIEHFSSLKGLGDAMLFGGVKGIIDPKDFQDVEKMSKMIQNTGQRIRQLTGGDPLRLAAIQPMLEKMGLTLTDARALMEMSSPENFAKIAKQIKEAQALREKNSTLEERYREQQMASGHQWEMLKNQLSAFTHLALIPLLNWITSALESVNHFLQKFSDFVSWIRTGTDGFAKSLRGVIHTLQYVVSFIAGTAFLGFIVQTGIKIVRVIRATFGLVGSILSWVGGLIRSFGSMIGRVVTTASSFIARFGRFFAAIGRGIGAAGSFLGRVFAVIGRGIGVIAARLAVVVGAIYGAIKIIQLGVEAVKLWKSKQYEKVTSKGLAEHQAEVRSKYNLPAGMDTATWLRQQNQARWQEQRINGINGTSTSTPYQPQVLPTTPKVIVLDSNNKFQTTLMSYHFNRISDKLDGLNTTVSKTGDKQIKADEKISSREMSNDRLMKENESLRTRPSTIYGIEQYAP
jgi:endonuclease IV